MKENTKKAISWLILFTIVSISIIYLLPKGIILFLPFVIGWIISKIVSPLVNFLERKVRIKRKYASLFAIIITLLVIASVLYLIIARLVIEAQNFISNLPDILGYVKYEFGKLVNNIEVKFDTIPEDYVTNINNFIYNLIDSGINFIKSMGVPTLQFAGSFVLNIPKAIIFIITMLLSAFFLSSEQNLLSNLGRKIFPEGIVNKVTIINSSMRNALGGYIKAQLIIMSIIFVILFFGFSILKVEYAMLLAFLICLFDALPFFGTGGILIPWSIYNFITKDTNMGIGLLVLYGIALITRQLIEPKIIGDSIGLHPLTTLLSLYIGLNFLGVLGLILGPVSVIIIKTLYKEGAFDNLIKSVKYLIREIRKALT